MTTKPANGALIPGRGSLQKTSPGNFKRKIADRAATVMFYLIAGCVVSLILFMLGYLLVGGYKHVDWKFITSPSKNLEAGGGIGPQIFDSFYLLTLAMAICLPVGIGAAIYISEYSRGGKVAEALNIACEILASSPSVVMGLFGMLVFVTWIGMGYSILAGALTLMVLNLPVVVRVAQEALGAVPRSLREASFALGAGKWETIRKVVLPAAMPRLITGIILATGRVFGEAAALIFTAGMSAPPLQWNDFNPFSFSSPLNPLRPAETLAVHLWKVNSESLLPDVRRVADGTALVLVCVVLAFNLAARGVSSWLQRKMTGST